MATELRGSSPANINSLEESLGGSVHTRLIDRVKYAHDASHYLYTPKAVVEARSAQEVAAAFSAGRSQGIPVTLRSGGTSLSGQASGDGILVDVRKHFRDVEVLDGGKRVRVQPGATVRQVNARLHLYGRKLGPDPASEGAATLGGVLANNSSGMACGTEFNAYRTLDSMTFVLPSGTVINTAEPDANQQLRSKEPELFDTLQRLTRRVRENEESKRLIKRHFSLKNTMGYGVNAFLDYDSPVDIFQHLLIGSEGTLAFIAEAILRTIPIPRLKTTSIAVFKSIDAATRALPELTESEAATLELMDSRSILVGRDFGNVPDEINGFDVDQHAALLIEYHADEEEQLRQYEATGEHILRDLDVESRAQFSTDQTQATKAWNFRKGLYAQVAKARPSGTTALLEDVVVPVSDLADTCGGLQELFNAHGYNEAVIFGHAKDGNIHFLITDRFEGEKNLNRYSDFTEEMADLVLSAHGNLKAEHGTGRVMAPYVRRQYGDELYSVMQEIKSAADPKNTMNPGVIITDDAQEHMRNMKLNAPVEGIIDDCVECGYCEPVCPSRDLTMTPRQRIVVRRERAKALAAGDMEAVRQLDRDYKYDGIQTCAADSMCMTACPVGIDTGKFVKSLRKQDNSAAVKAGWKAAAHAWDPGNQVASMALTGAHFLPDSLVQKVTDVGRALLSKDLVPQYQPELSKGGKPRSRYGTMVGAEAIEPSGVYVPACVNSMFGPQSDGKGVSDAFVSLITRAGISLKVPEDVDGLCCGTPWTSKGMEAGHRIMKRRVQESLIRATENSRLPVIVDASSCTAGFKEIAEEVGITVCDVLSFTAEHVVPRVDVSRRVESLTLHPTCSAYQLGLVDAMRVVAEAAARKVNIPVNWNCCGYAGDRGMLHPELTESATRAEAAEVKELDADFHASTNRTCELGLTRATGRAYLHVLEILERATR